MRLRVPPTPGVFAAKLPSGKWCGLRALALLLLRNYRDLLLWDMNRACIILTAVVIFNPYSLFFSRRSPASNDSGLNRPRICGNMPYPFRSALLIHFLNPKFPQPEFFRRWTAVEAKFHICYPDR